MVNWCRHGFVNNTSQYDMVVHKCGLLVDNSLNTQITVSHLLYIFKQSQ